MMDPLIAAALRDQERRILEATPREVSRERAGRPRTNMTRSGGTCGACGGSIATWNATGFCSRTKACIAARCRRSQKAVEIFGSEDG
jgi:hypothetical protein